MTLSEWPMVSLPAHAAKAKPSGDTLQWFSRVGGRKYCRCLKDELRQERPAGGRGGCIQSSGGAGRGTYVNCVI